MQKRVVRPRGRYTKQTRILNRVITWGRRGIEYEADPRHAEAIVKDLTLESANPVATPAEKHPPVCPDDEDDLDAKRTQSI